MRSLMIGGFAALIASVALAGGHGDAPMQKDSEWFKNAQEVLKQKLAQQPNMNRAKNVILFIADGNGVGSNYATRLFHGQKNGGFGDENILPYEQFSNLALVKTYNTNAQTPDSAGTGTAMHAGVKTKAGVLGVNDKVVRGDCSTVDGAMVNNASEIFTKMNKAVGIVSTARITHATPASVYAHSADRNFEDNSKLPDGCGQKDIAAQLIDAMKDGRIDVAMGGGRRHFIEADVADEEGKNGKRTDGMNLVEEAKKLGAQYAWNDKTAGQLKTDGTPILALFESSHMKYEADRTGEPSIAEMTELAIKSLSNNKEGFFLSVESGRVDHANHDGNAQRMVTDGVAFAEAVAKAMDMTNPEETLIIVTADHEHAIAFNGYCGRGSPITGLCYGIDGKGTKHNGKPVTADDGKPYTVIGYLNGPGSVLKKGDNGYEGSRPDLTNEQAMDIDYLQQALIPKSSETHSGEDVAAYAHGPQAHLINGTIEQNYIFHVIHHAFTAK